MKYDVKVPAVGESINEATIGSWLKQNGEAVKRNDVLMSLETDKATVEVVAEQDGVLQISVQAGQVVAIGAVVAQIDSDAKASVASSAPSAATPPPAAPAPTMSAPAASNNKDFNLQLSPAVQRVVSERGLDPQTIQGTGRDGRLTKDDVVRAPAPAAVAVINTPNSAAPAASTKATTAPVTARGPAKQGDQRRVPMTTIRRRIAERLVQSQQTTATLTTFNEVDMTRAMEIRAKYKDKFKERYGVSLGFMGIFVKAATDALQTMPAVNAFIDGQDVIYNNYFNIGVAVSTEKGLLVPVVRDADQLSIPQIESAIRDYALKARDGKITMDDLSGGTFTISNGGVFGSLMSTPILNPPQSGILGMHKIQDRPVVVDGKIEIRPMMYIALSYDHRMIDGREAVTFLVKIKEGVEDPERLLIGV